MTRLFLTNPGALWWLAALAAVLAFYLFYRRYRPQPVTGLFLWGVPRREAKGGRKIQSPLLGRSFLLDMAAAALLALALAGPAWRGESGLDMVVVLDDSYGMRARDCRRSALALAESILDQAQSAGVSAAVVIAGGRPRIFSGMGTPAAEAKSRLRELYRPASETADLAGAVALARDLYGRDLEIRIVSNRDDEPPMAADSVLFMHVLRGRGGNVAFADTWRLADGSGGETLGVWVKNWSDAPARARLEVFPALEKDPLSVHHEELALEAGKTEGRTLRLTGLRDTPLLLRLTALAGEDVIADDSLAHVAPVPERVVTFAGDAVDQEDWRYFRLALAAAGCVELPAGDGIPALLVTSNPEAAGGCLTLELPPPNDPGVFNPPFIVDLANPLCRDVNLASASWAVADAGLTPSPEQTYIMAGRYPLYWRSRSNRLHLNVWPSRSSLVNVPAWPALAANLAARVRGLLPGLGKSNYRPGEPLAYGWGGESLAASGIGLYAGDVLVKDMPAWRETTLPSEAGLYAVRNASGEAVAVAVFPFYGDAADAETLSAGEKIVGSAPAELIRRGGARDLTWLCLALGLACLFANWRRNGGAKTAEDGEQ